MSLFTNLYLFLILQWLQFEFTDLKLLPLNLWLFRFPEILGANCILTPVEFAGYTMCATILTFDYYKYDVYCFASVCVVWISQYDRF